MYASGGSHHQDRSTGSDWETDVLWHAAKELTGRWTHSQKSRLRSLGCTRACHSGDFKGRHSCSSQLLQPLHCRQTSINYRDYRRGGTLREYCLPQQTPSLQLINHTQYSTLERRHPPAAWFNHHENAYKFTIPTKTLVTNRGDPSCPPSKGN